MISATTAGNRLFKKLNKTKVKGNLLGKAKAFASKLGEKFGSEDESVEVFDDKSSYDETGFDNQTKGRRQRERDAAAEAEKKKKMTSYIIMGAALVFIMILKKK